MKTIIKVEKDDIITSRIGCNVEVQVDEKFSIVFSPEALDELVKDYTEIKAEIESLSVYPKKDFGFGKDPNQLEIEFPKEEELYTTT